MPPPTPLRRLDRLLHGPRPALPRPLDAVSDRWAGLRPRVRVLVAAGAVLVLAAGVQARVNAADDRWGGAPVDVWVATEDLPVGAPPTGLRRVALPPVGVPPEAVSGPVHAGAVLALALPAGAVLTGAHLDARGPAAGLHEQLRVVPVPVEEGWAVTAGGWVDVWVLGAGEEPAALVARSRPVVDVRHGTSATTALIALDQDAEVAAATTGLALGRVLLAHAPPPPGEGRRPASR